MNQKGVTVIEFGIVLAIIGILVAIAIPAYNNHISKLQELAKTEEEQKNGVFMIDHVNCNPENCTITVTHPPMYIFDADRVRILQPGDSYLKEK